MPVVSCIMKETYSMPMSALNSRGMRSIVALPPFGAFAVTQDDHAEAVAAQTGWDFTAQELRTVAERAWNLTRLFNLREGFGPQDDTLPERLFADASTAGPSQGERVDRELFRKMREEYYGVMGWDPATGVPTPDKLRQLGLEGSAQG